MPHHRRHEDPDRYYLISNRTHHGQFLFRPDEECRRICRAALARAAERRNVKLAAYVFPSNHFHLVAAVPDRNRAAFMCDFEGELARRINIHRDRSETVFPRPYHPEALLDAESVLHAISYTVNNTVRHGLVTHPGAWPGVCSTDQVRNGAPLVGHWLDRNRWYNFRRRKETPPRKEAMTEHRVDLVVPTCIAGETEAERRETLLERLEKDRRNYCKDAGLDRHKRSRNPKHYTSVDWRTKQTIDEEWCDIRRACAGEEDGTVARYLKRRRTIDRRYRAAAEAWKRGEKAVFPVGTYPPGRAQCVEQLEARAPPTDAA